MVDYKSPVMKETLRLMCGVQLDCDIKVHYEINYDAFFIDLYIDSLEPTNSLMLSDKELNLSLDDLSQLYIEPWLWSVANEQCKYDDAGQII